MQPKSAIKVESQNIRYLDGHVEADYEYDHVVCQRGETGQVRAFPMKAKVTFRTKTKVPRFGLMLVGWGGNNGTTVTAAILANKQGLSWRTKDGVVKANYFGSLTQCSTVNVGKDEDGVDVFLPMKDLIPMVNPNDIILDGWDISSANLAEAMRRAMVIDVGLQDQLWHQMQQLHPRPAVFDPDFVAANQQERADNLVQQKHKWEQVEQIRADIRDFKAKNQLDSMVVLWTANTERYVNVTPGLHDTSANLLRAIQQNESEISPSILYAVASILEGVTYLNGSPQNTFVPGLLQLASEHSVFIGGDDFKSGQTKFKSVLVDFLISAGIKPSSIVSYNHLGNNDGYNLSAPQTFRSKEISKSNVVDDMVASNQILYGQGKDHPDHCVVIKYVPFVGDSKRAMDEYSSELMLGGRNTITVHNVCEDSLLASPIILDLAILAELFQRVQVKVHGSEQPKFQHFHSVLSLLSYLLKAPLAEPGAPVVNALFKQRACIENVLRALIALPPLNHVDLEFKLSDRTAWQTAPAHKVIVPTPKAQVRPVRCADCSTGLNKQTATGFA